MDPASTPNVKKVIDNLHMLWMGIWIHHHAITTTLAGPDLGSRLKTQVIAWHQKKPLSIG
jgi:ABC-type lipopolysaccharide export system ATPase subunit